MSLTLSAVSPDAAASAPTPAPTPSRREVPTPYGMVSNTQLQANLPELAHLTPTDLEVVYQATGSRLSESSTAVPPIAAQIATDRKQGTLAAGQTVNPDYVNQLVQQSTAQGSASMAAQARAALDYLQARGGKPGVNVLV